MILYQHNITANYGRLFTIGRELTKLLLNVTTKFHLKIHEYAKKIHEYANKQMQSNPEPIIIYLKISI